VVFGEQDLRAAADQRPEQCPDQQRGREHAPGKAEAETDRGQYKLGNENNREVDQSIDFARHGLAKDRLAHAQDLGNL
jgi:hypothetical protein